MGKSTSSMAMFNSYVSLPEGMGLISKLNDMTHSAAYGTEVDQAQGIAPMSGHQRRVAPEM